MRAMHAYSHEGRDARSGQLAQKGCGANRTSSRRCELVRHMSSPVTLIAQLVLPCSASVSAMIPCRPVASDASNMAVSLASEPLAQKNVRLIAPGAIAASRSASRNIGSVR